MKRIIGVLVFVGVIIPAWSQQLFDDVFTFRAIRADWSQASLVPEGVVIQTTDILARHFTGFPSNEGIRRNFAREIGPYEEQVMAYFAERVVPNPFIDAATIEFLWPREEAESEQDPTELEIGAAMEEADDVVQDEPDNALRSINTGIPTSIDDLFGSLGLPELLGSVVTFLVDRAQLEASGYLLDELADILAAYPEFEILLPRTTRTFASILESLRGMETALPRLRFAFADDMRRLPEHLLHLQGMSLDGPEDVALRARSYRAFFQDPTNEPVVFALLLVQSMVDGDSFDTISRRLDRFARSRDNGSVVAQVVTLTNLVSDSFQKRSIRDAAWISEERVLLLFEDSELQSDFFAFVFERALSEGIKIGDRAMITILAEYADPRLLQDLTDGYARIFPILKEVERLAGVAAAPDVDDTARLAAALDVARGVAELYGDPENIRWVLPAIRDSDIEAVMEEFSDYVGYTIEFVEAVSGGNYERAFAALSTIIDRLVLAVDEPGVQEVFAQVNEYGSIIAALATAESNEEMTVVLERYAAPAGSYRRKYIDDVSVAVNAYVGFTGGLEWDINRIFVGWPGMLAPFAPIGISVNFHPFSVPGWPLTIFAGLIDVGMLAQFRLGTDAGTPLPNLHVANLLSPALYVAVNLGDSPFTLGFGGGLSPGLQPSGIDEPLTGTQRFRLILYGAVDVPIVFF